MTTPEPLTLGWTDYFFLCYIGFAFLFGGISRKLPKRKPKQKAATPKPAQAPKPKKRKKKKPKKQKKPKRIIAPETKPLSDYDKDLLTRYYARRDGYAYDNGADNAGQWA